MTSNEILERGRQEFLEAIDDIPDHRAKVKPSADGWSVLECIEHVIAVENRYLTWLSADATIVPKPDRVNELWLRVKIRNRRVKVEAPAEVQPKGRFSSLSEAIVEFKSVRDRSITFAKERAASLYSIGIKHPHFGNLNAVELFRLLDGHTHRHIEQIVETAAIPEQTAPPLFLVKVKSKTQKHIGKAFNFRRDEPDLPSSFDVLNRLHVEEDRVSIEDGHLKDLEQPNLRIGPFQMNGCLLERIQFHDSEFGAIVWKDVRLIGCDLANIRAHRITLVRVELIDCRLTGFRSSSLDCQDVLIRNSDLRYAQLQGGKFKNCEFDGCNLQESDFQNADLSGSVLRSCDLGRSDFQHAILRNTDLRHSKVEEMTVGIGDLRGAIVDPTQAMIFAKLLGVQIA